MRDNLAASLKLMFGDEGGYSNRKSDKGGPTKYGITHKTLAAYRGVGSVTAEQVKRLTLKEAEDIYVTSYWGPSGGDALPAGLDYAAFDFGVNSGPMTAVKVLQKALGITADGWIGPQTLSAVESFKGGVTVLIEAYCLARMDYLRSLKNRKTGFPVNGRGWTIRVTGVDPKGEWPDKPGVVGNALAMAGGKKVVVPSGRPSQPVPAGGDSKATPSTPNPWVKPEVILPGLGATGTALLPTLQDSLPLQIALGVVAVIIIGLGAFYAFRRIQRSA